MNPKIISTTNITRPVTGPDGDNPIRDEQIRELRDAVRVEIEHLIGIKNACLDALDVGTRPEKAAAVERCAAAYNARRGGSVAIADVAHVVRNALVPARYFAERSSISESAPEGYKVRALAVVDSIDRVLAYVDGLVKRAQAEDPQPGADDVPTTPYETVVDGDEA